MSGVHAIALEREGSGLRNKMNGYNSKCLSALINSHLIKHPTYPTLRAVEKHGSDWLAIADLVFRTPADCCDR
jgi:hypothetical protein